MSKHSLFFSTVLLLFFSCGNDKLIRLEEPRFQPVKYESVKVKGLPAYYYAFNVCILDRYMLLYEDIPFPRYNLIDLESKELIRTFGQEEGPYKIGFPYCSCQLIKNGDSLYTVLSDGGYSRVLLNLHDESLNPAFSLKRIEIPELEMSTSMVYFSKDQSKLFGFSATQASVFEYDLSSKKVNLFAAGPDLKVNSDQITRANIFFAGTGVSPNGKFLGVAYNYFNLIEIFDADFNLHQAITIGRSSTDIPVMIDRAPIESTKMYSGFILFGKKNIYVPYYNQEIRDIERNEYIKILIINLTDFSIKGIKIPQRLTSLAIDAQENYLYATTEDDSSRDGNLIRVNVKGL